MRLGAIRCAQTHMDVCSSRHRLVLVRALLRHARRGRYERDVMVAAKEEWNRVSFCLRWQDAVRSGHKDVV